MDAIAKVKPEPPIPTVMGTLLPADGGGEEPAGTGAGTMAMAADYRPDSADPPRTMMGEAVEPAGPPPGQAPPGPVEPGEPVEPAKVDQEETLQERMRRMQEER